jgi:hypothetical protein
MEIVLVIVSALAGYFVLLTIGAVIAALTMELWHP